jgi:hypothetical protein
MAPQNPARPESDARPVAYRLATGFGADGSDRWLENGRMGICADKSVHFLKSMGLNVIRQPAADIAPGLLIGEFKGSIGLIGELSDLVEPPAPALPPVTSATAADISGQRTSKLPLSLGLDILGGIIGALGGNLGIKAAYEGARTVEFQYKNVIRERMPSVKVGDFLTGADVRFDHLILEKYLFGKGNLYVIVEVVKSNEIGVTAFRKDKTSIGLDVPAIKGIVGANLEVGPESEGSHTVVYKGAEKLAFGFVAIELSAGVRGPDGELDLVFRPVKDGMIALSPDDQGPVVMADFAGAIDALPRIDPATVG